MNTSIIRYVLGKVLWIEGLFMLLPCIVAVIYQETSGFAFLAVALFAIALGHSLSRRKLQSSVFYLKEGCIATALSWILISVVGALPFTLAGEIPSYTDALFETISGFTTTGSSILSDVEALSYCALFWRSFTHWIGGMGVLVFLLAIVPLSGGSNMNLLRTESPGPSVGKLVPKMKQTARILYLIYLFLTLLMLAFLLIGKMPLFDALCTSFGTAGTGGFGILNDSIASYSPYIQWVTTIFMILFGVNFNAYYFILFRQFSKAFKMEEVRYYFLIILSAILIILVNTWGMFENLFEALTHVSFTVGTIITTTGFATTNFDAWPETSRLVIVFLMIIGSCAGSTGGGMKVSRFLISFKSLAKEFHSYIHPHSVKKIQLDGKPIEHEVIRSVNIYCFIYVIIFAVSVFLISLEGYDFTTNLTAVAATINNIGPGLSKVGPTCNFGFLSDLSKYVLMFDMLAGRLELLPLLILFHPRIWIDMIRNKRKN